MDKWAKSQRPMPLADAMALSCLQAITVFCRRFDTPALFTAHVHHFAFDLPADLEHGHAIRVAFEGALLALARLFPA